MKSFIALSTLTYIYKSVLLVWIAGIPIVNLF